MNRKTETHSQSIGPERELQIYQQRMTGEKPSVPVPVALLEQKAKEVLSEAVYCYIAGGAGGERTMRANLEAFYQWRIVPQMLRDVSSRDLSIKILGTKLPFPVILAPVGVQGIIRPEGDLASGRAAASLGLPFVLSTVSSHSIEKVAEAMGDGPRWFQLYWGKDHKLAASMVQRAERAGYSAIVVTLDTRYLAWRERDLQNGYLPFLLGEGLANYAQRPSLSRPTSTTARIKSHRRRSPLGQGLLQSRANLARSSIPAPPNAPPYPRERNPRSRRRRESPRSWRGWHHRLQPRWPPG